MPPRLFTFPAPRTLRDALRSVARAARDRDRAVVVVAARPATAIAALSRVPRGRVAHHLDVARPEVGLDPLTGGDDAAAIARRVAVALGEVEGGGDATAERWLRDATHAVVVAGRRGALGGERATLWHAYRLLIPSEAALRDRVVAALLGEAGCAGPARFLGQELPAALRDHPTVTSARLDVPRTLLLRLLIPAVDQTLRHPRPVSLDRVVEAREALVVDVAREAVGPDRARAIARMTIDALADAAWRCIGCPALATGGVTLVVADGLAADDAVAPALATAAACGVEVAVVPAVRAGMREATVDEAVVRHHVAAQRARGGGPAARLPEPLPDEPGNSWGRTAPLDPWSE
ncbi:hypothetical protein [Conexibacter woesei]|uniref:hypothetical protein n=1 Tax=Conexibacter woesei TaxID=191495 RepID=UPI0004284C4C|nr:hypothetical protein [Conexibacter woesei]